MSRARLVLVALAIVAGAHAGADEARTLPPGSPHFVTVLDVEGAPADSAERAAFWVVFRSAFLEQGFVTEKPGGRQGRFTVSVPLINRFVLLEGSGGAMEGDAYRVRVGIEWLKDATPAGKRPKRGAPAPRSAPESAAARAHVSVLAIPPGVDPDLVRLAAARDTVTFETPRAPRGPFLGSVARNAAILTLEHVHRLAGELPEEERLKLERAARVTVGPAPGR